MFCRDYSWTDRVVALGASVMLAVLAVAALVLRYVTDIIICRSSSDDYLLDRCYHQSEIWIVPLVDEDLEKYLEYAQPSPTRHQWVPFALGIGTLFCLLPHAFWRMLSGLVWLDTHALLCILDENQRREPGERRQVLREVASFLQSGLKRTTVALTLATLGRKLLAAVSCFLIFVLSEALFKPRLGPGGSEDVDYNASSPASVPLPTDPFICQLSIRQYSRVQRYTMECIIPINQVYSKGFTFLFYAFLLLTFLCLFDFFLWLGRVMIPALRDLDVKRYLDAKSASEGSVRASSKPVLAPFAEFLGWDGRLLLALAGDYCGPLSAAELTVHLWQVFKASQSARPFSAPAAMPVTTAGSGVTSAAGRRGEVTEIPLAVMDERADDTAVSTNDRVPLSPREG